MAHVLRSGDALQYIAMKEAKQLAKLKPTKNKENKAGSTRYAVVMENGNTMPSFRAFVLVQSLFNRASKRYRAEWKLNTTQINILFMIDQLHYCKGHVIPFAVTTLIRNYSCSREMYNTVLNYLNKMSVLGFITLSYNGVFKGAKVGITPLGSKCVRDIYEEMERVCNYYPEQK